MYGFVYLDLRPVGEHAGAMIVLPPFEVLLLVDGHQGLMEFIVNFLYTDVNTHTHTHVKRNK